MATLPPGVPPLPPGVAGLFALPALLTSDSVSAIVGFGAPVWGIFDQNNNRVITADNVLVFDYKRTWKLPNYQTENGGFANYDKVTLPYDAKITLSQGGSDSDRATFLSTLETIGASLDLYNIVTPEITYLSSNINMFGYRRTAEDGATLISVDIGLTEIRQGATASFTNTAQPSGADQVNGGAVQPVPATPAQQSAIEDLT